MAGPILTSVVHPIVFPPSTQKVDAEEDNDVFFDCEEEFDAPMIPSELQRLASRDIVDHSIEIEEDDDSEFADAEFVDARDSFEDEVMTSEGPLWMRCVDKVTGVATNVVESKTAKKLSNFSQTKIGNKLLQSSIGFVGHKVGMMVGTTFPTATMGLTVGRAIASKITPESKNKSTIVHAAGIFTGLTATSLTLLTGTPVEYSWVFGYLMQTGGAIAGGINGLMATGQEVHASYIPRAAASLVAMDAVGETVSAISSVVSSTSLPSIVSTTIAVAGEVLSTVSGRIGYYAPEFFQFASQKRERGKKTMQLAKPAEFLNRVVIEAGGSEVLAAGIASHLDLTTIKGFVREEKQDNIVKESNQLIAEIIAGSINSKVGVNAFVRAVNSSTKLLSTKDIQNDIKQLNACADRQQKQLLIQALKRKLILSVLQGAYGEEDGIRTNKLCDLFMNKFASHLDGVLDVLSPIIQEIENDYIGVQVYSEKTKDLLSVIMPALLLLIPINASYERQNPRELSESENRDFYNNVADLFLTILTPNKENILRSGFKWISKEALIWRFAQDEDFLETIAVKIGKNLKERLYPDRGIRVKPFTEPLIAEQKLPDPVNILQTAVMQMPGNSQAFSTRALKALELQPLIEKMVGIFINKSFIDIKVGTNAIVRALNEYVTLIQDQNIQDKIEKLKTWKDPQKRKSLKVLIGQRITSKVNAKYSVFEGVLSDMMQHLSTTRIDQMIERFVTVFEEKEKKFLGELTSREAHKDLLDVYLPPLLSLMTIYATRSIKENPELTETELETFYSNVENIVLSPYQEFRMVKDLHKLVDGFIPMVLKRTTFISDIISKFVEDALAPAVKPRIEGELKKSRFSYFFSFFSVVKVASISIYHRLLLPLFRGIKTKILS